MKSSQERKSGNKAFCRGRRRAGPRVVSESAASDFSATVVRRSQSRAVLELPREPIRLTTCDLLPESSILLLVRYQLLFVIKFPR